MLYPVRGEWWQMTITEAIAAKQGVWSREFRRLTLGLITLISGTAATTLGISTAMPAAARDLGGIAIYGWAFSAFMLADLVGLIVAGSETDRQGPARPFVLGAIAYALGLLVAALAPSMLIIIIGRMIQGFGSGFIANVAYVAIGRAYPAALKPRMLTLISSAWVVPGLVGPAIAGTITDHFGWRWVFLALAVPMPIAATLVIGSLRTLERDHLTPRDWRRIRAAARLALGVTCLLIAANSAAPSIVVLLTFGGALLAAPALHHIMPPGFLRVAHGLPATILTMGLLNLVYDGIDVFLPFSLIAIRGQSATVAGLVLTVASLTWTLGALFQERIGTTVARRVSVTLGLSILFVGISVVLLALYTPAPVLVALLGWAIGGLGIGIAYSTLSLVVLEMAPPGQEGSATSAMSLAIVVGTALGAGIGGALIAHTGTSAQQLLRSITIQDVLMLCLLVCGIFVAQRMGQR